MRPMRGTQGGSGVQDLGFRVWGLGYDIGLYWDTGKENGSYYLALGV